MKVKSIGFRNFRNLDESVVSTDAKVVVVEGRNGVGKTSFLECVYSSLLLSSFRTARLSDAIRHDMPYCQMRCSVNKGGSQYEVLTYCDRDKKSIKVNDENIAGYSRLFSLFSAAVMSYDDKKIVSSGPEERRKYVNQLSCFIDAGIADVIRSYSVVLRERNKAVKEKRTDVLDALDEKIASIGFRIVDERRKLIPFLEKYVNGICRNVFSIPGNLGIELKSNCDVGDVQEYDRLLKSFRSRDDVLACTSIGPHRDDLVLRYEGRLARDEFSTGQIRLLSIMLKLALIDMISDRAGYSPIVLVDDVLLELDEEKKHLVFQYLLKYRQVFYTFLPQESFYRDYCDDMLVYEIRDGRIGGDGNG